MSEPIAEWLERQADRSFSRQRVRVETAKLIATFVAGVSATLVATALQVGKPTYLDLAAALLLGAAILTTFGVVQADRLTEADHEAIVLRAASEGWPPDRTLRRLRSETVAAVAINEIVVKRVQSVLIFQVVVAALGSAVAIVSLLVPNLVS